MAIENRSSSGCGPRFLRAPLTSRARFMRRSLAKRLMAAGRAIPSDAQREDRGRRRARSLRNLGDLQYRVHFGGNPLQFAFLLHLRNEFAQIAVSQRFPPAPAGLLPVGAPSHFSTSQSAFTLHCHTSTGPSSNPRALRSLEKRAPHVLAFGNEEIPMSSLNHDQLARGAILAMEQGWRLLSDAVLLFRAGRYPSSLGRFNFRHRGAGESRNFPR